MLEDDVGGKAGNLEGSLESRLEGIHGWRMGKYREEFWIEGVETGTRMAERFSWGASVKRGKNCVFAAC